MEHGCGIADEEKDLLYVPVRGGNKK